MQPKIVSRKAWLEARLAHLANERALTHARDRLLEERRALPWVRVETDYVFQDESGQVRLADLFDGRSQLFVQRFMLIPGSDHVCEGCSITADQVDSARQHFEHADLSFVAVSRVPLARILDVKRRMGWRFRWVSSAESSFNFDFGVSFTDEQIAAGKPLYNYGTTPYLHPDLHGSTVFAKDAEGNVCHTYSAYARGAESLCTPFHWLDMTPKGRNEQGTMSWVRLEDEYDAPAHQGCCGSPQAAE